MNELDISNLPAERLRLTVGPVQYYWTRPTLTQFYADVAESPADTVVLGEAVCSRRHEMKLDDWLASCPGPQGGHIWRHLGLNRRGQQDDAGQSQTCFQKGISPGERA